MPKVLTFTLIGGLAFSILGCGRSTSSPASSASSSLVIPLGAAVTGVTLSGPLAGKKMYLLPATVNPSQCWNDSVKWTGTELFYGISNLNWTELNAGSYVINGACSPQPPLSVPVNGYFNIYRGVVSGTDWVLSSVPFNAGITASQAAPTLSGSTLAFVKYEKTGSYGNIYLTTRTGDNSYSTPSAFSNNSTSCNEDNPVLYSSGTKIIFESNRTAPANGSACNSGVQRFWSSQLSGTTWSTPAPLVGAPANSANTAIQPWVDETTGNLFWTAVGSDCTGGPYATCVQMATPSGSGWSNTPTQIIAPTAIGSLAAGDVALVGQFTQGNGYAFAVCGLLQPGSGPHYYVSNLALFFSICVVPL